MAEDIKIKYINIGSENLPVKSAEKDKKVSEVINILAEKPLNIKANEADDKDGQDLLQDLLYILSACAEKMQAHLTAALISRHAKRTSFT